MNANEKFGVIFKRDTSPLDHYVRVDYVTACEGLARKRLQLASEIYRARVSPPSSEVE
jgi:hypothetical protein